VISVPWELLGVLVLGAFAVVGATSGWTSLYGTRVAPVSWS
jgi:putative ABC transport system permease protein